MTGIIIKRIDSRTRNLIAEVRIVRLRIFKCCVMERYCQIYAEAANEINNPGEALAKLNIIRKRARLADAPRSRTGRYAPGYLESREEGNLGRMEHDRFWDLCKAGACRPVRDESTWEKLPVDGKHELFSIPQEQYSKWWAFRTKPKLLMRFNLIKPAYRLRFTGSRTEETAPATTGDFALLTPRATEDL